MDSSHEDIATPLIHRDAIPTPVPDKRQPDEKQLAVNIILVSILLERIAFYTLLANIALNLETSILSWQSKNSSIASYIFSGFSYISTIVFALVSDAKLGRAKTIILGFILYLIGYIMAILVITKKITENEKSVCGHSNSSSINTIFEERCASWILATLVVIAMGAGAVQANMAVFGADQIQESKVTSRFFDKYILVVNIGAALAMLATPYTLNDSTVYRIVYIVTASMLFAATIVFIMGWKYYLHTDLYDTVITNCIPVIMSAFRSWRKHRRDRRSIERQRSNSSTSHLSSGSHSLPEDEESTRIDERPRTFLDYARVQYDGDFHNRIVNDVKSLRKALIVFTLLIPYWLIYHQINSLFRVQSQPVSNVTQEQQTFVLISLADPITIIIGISILYLFVYKCVDARNRSSSVATKFVIGMCFAVLTMIIAGSVQTTTSDECINKNGDSGKNLKISYNLIPRGVFMGFSEIFAMLASFEYAYFAAPRTGETLFMSLRFCSVGIASFMGAGYLAIFPMNSSRPISTSHVSEPCSNSYIYFFSLAGLQLIFIIIFIICQNKFRIIKLNPQQMEIDQLLQHSTHTTRIA